ncbi:hypothetical protein XENOCAPTIV_012933, partial [Xenoophorus captivus]
SGPSRRRLHADVPESCVRFVGTMVDEVIITGNEVPTTGEEESLVVVQSYDDLSRKLWKLEDLPLSITAVQALSTFYHSYNRPCPTHLDVWKVYIIVICHDGLVFRIQVAYHREPQVLRESVNAEGLLVVRDNEEAQALEMATIHKPLLTSTLHGYI